MGFFHWGRATTPHSSLPWRKINHPLQFKWNLDILFRHWQDAVIWLLIFRSLCSEKRVSVGQWSDMSESQRYHRRDVHTFFTQSGSSLSHPWAKHCSTRFLWTTVYSAYFTQQQYSLSGPVDSFCFKFFLNYLPIYKQRQKLVSSQMHFLCFTLRTSVAWIVFIPSQKVFSQLLCVFTSLKRA